MFQRKIIQHQQPVILNKNKSSYRKVERAMKEGVKEYEQIKKLVEDTEGDIIKNNAIKLTPHQSKKNINIKSKKYIKKNLNQ
jgi:hypothetical protein